MSKSERQLKYLVTGTGRCGTVYMAHLLKEVGIPCGHESFFGFRGLKDALPRLAGNFSVGSSSIAKDSGLVLDENLIAESSYMAAPFLSHPLFDQTKVIHLVRNPLDVISSFLFSFHYFGRPNNGGIYEQMIYGVFPELQQTMLTVERAALYYVLWNRMIEKREDRYFHRIEDSIEPVLEFLGKSDFASTVDRSHKNSKPRKMRVSLSNMPDSYIKDQLVLIMKDYGYRKKMYL